MDDPVAVLWPDYSTLSVQSSLWGDWRNSLRLEFRAPGDNGLPPGDWQPGALTVGRSACLEKTDRSHRQPGPADPHSRRQGSCRSTGSTRACRCGPTRFDSSPTIGMASSSPHPPSWLFPKPRWRLSTWAPMPGATTSGSTTSARRGSTRSSSRAAPTRFRLVRTAAAVGALEPGSLGPGDHRLRIPRRRHRRDHDQLDSSRGRRSVGRAAGVAAGVVPTRRATGRGEPPELLHDPWRLRPGFARRHGDDGLRTRRRRPRASAPRGPASSVGSPPGSLVDLQLSVPAIDPNGTPVAGYELLIDGAVVAGSPDLEPGTTGRVILDLQGLAEGDTRRQRTLSLRSG